MSVINENNSLNFNIEEGWKELILEVIMTMSQDLY